MNKNIQEAIINALNNSELKTTVDNAYNTINAIAKSLQPIIDKMKESARILAEHSIKLGFYPCNRFSLHKLEFIELRTSEEEVEYISNKIRELLTEDYMNEISGFFCKEKIMKVYHDYQNKDYETVILNLIIILNSIFNERLDCVSTEQIEDIYRVCNNILTGVQLPNKSIRKKQKDVDWEKIIKIHKKEGFEKYAYYIFAPYYYTDINKNPLFKNCYKADKPTSIIKKEYKSIPYNRNAIIHGYVEDYGTEINCLRWFSVLINTYEMFKLLEELRVNE